MKCQLCGRTDGVSSNQLMSICTECTSKVNDGLSRAMAPAPAPGETPHVIKLNATIQFTIWDKSGSGALEVADIYIGPLEELIRGALRDLHKMSGYHFNPSVCVSAPTLREGT